MRKFVILLALSCIGIAVYFGFIRKPLVSERVRILPGIEVVFTRDENAADYYAKACESLRRRYEGDRHPESLTPEEREWFMLGTSCRRSSWYPEHYPHVTAPGGKLPQLRYQRALGRIVGREGRSAEEDGDVKRAMDIWKRIAVMGWHLESEEECLLQVFTGIAIEELAYLEFIRYYRERGDMNQARRYQGFKRRWRDSYRSKELQKVLINSAADYPRVKNIALSHESPMFRKEACTSLAHPEVVRNPSLRQDAITTLRRISSEEPDPLVRETARNMIPYVLGQKR